jgi:hypothetical protein
MADSDTSQGRVGDPKNTDLRKTTIFLIGLAAFGTSVIIIWGVTRAGPAIALGLLLLGGSGLVGGVLGLLFGIPKSVSDPDALRASQTSNPSSGATANENETRASYTVNTNLEQISDWLTKIIVGVGLTQLPTIRNELRNLADYLGNGFAVAGASPPETAAPMVAAIILVYGLTAGFLAGYLLTRIFLPGAFVRADDQLRQSNIRLREQIVQERQLTERVGSAQGEIYLNLYKYSQEGFRKAIAKLEELLKSDAQKTNPALWTYLAAAHGQAYAWEDEHRQNSDPKKREILAEHRDRALQAVKEALKLGDAWKPILQVMWDKNHQIKKQNGMGKDEDDLEVFYDDKEFRELLGS